jgi:hypothetical protein
VVVLGTGLLVLGLDLGELDLHVVVAGSQRGTQGSVEGKEAARQGDSRREGEKTLTTQRSSSGHRQPSSHR